MADPTKPKRRRGGLPETWSVRIVGVAPLPDPKSDSPAAQRLEKALRTIMALGAPVGAA